ncbi:MAG: ornithine cyclodeaminase family protein [Pseudomonadales bacterium]|nr:ornithine cyclodeaminase family protein [Pseudomonadales bacterium]NRA14883.1 ornithine cyclodeaminase family protein [Oceanospirillaceae bacterium]
MTAIIELKEIQSSLGQIDMINAMQEGFIQYSNGNTVVPPVGELLFDEPKGEAHIKYGYIKNDDYFVIKIASGFYDNAQYGLQSSQGLMLLFAQKTGVPVAVLLDQGYLTDIRTAAAGALVAKYFAPQQIQAIGIIGTGIQAKLQLLQLQQYNPCKMVWVWGRNRQNCEKFALDLGSEFTVHIANSPAEVAANSNLIVTTTPSESALLKVEDIQAGTHITAVGADMASKQELSSQILKLADIVIVDSIPQSRSRGEVYRAICDGAITESQVLELGAAIQSADLQRHDDRQITVADLTGVAVQDIMIASAVYNQYLKNNQSV